VGIRFCVGFELDYKKSTRRLDGFQHHKQQAQQKICACCLSCFYELQVSLPVFTCLAADTH
jgi:hypothetical protein